jgi:hypothetical protein
MKKSETNKEGQSQNSTRRELVGKRYGGCREGGGIKTP